MKRGRNRRKSRLWIGGVCLSFCLLLAVLWIVADDLLVLRGVRSTSVEIPDWRGRTVDGITPAGWMEIELEYRHDSSAPAGVILRQEPEGGSRRLLSAARPQCKIRLVVSAGTETVTLPDVMGLDGRVAENQLRGIGLSVRVERIESAYPEGTVFDMMPRAGELMPIGGEVALSVSAGMPRESVRVPDLVGKTRGDALIDLWLAGLSVGEVVEENPQVGSNGRVVRQSHRAGTLVLSGTPITLYIGALESEPNFDTDTNP